MKHSLISKFLSQIDHSKKLSREDPEKIHQLLDYSDIIFSEYMMSQEESSTACETVKQLFEFEITREVFSDYLLFGDDKIHSDRLLVRKEAEWLCQKISDQKLSQGQPEIEKLIEKYPVALVFQYLKLKYQELISGTRKLSKTFKIYAERYPDYILFQYLYESSLLLNISGGVSQSIPDRMHLKNFYPGKTAFCREEVLHYVHFLILKFGLSSNIVMAEAIIDFMEENHPGLLPDSTILNVRIIKLSKVAEYCEKWASNGPISSAR
jgi:hypothetical protein